MKGNRKLGRVSAGARDIFDTEHLQANLGSRSAKSGALTVAVQGSNFVLTTLTTVVLARILEPEDFGLIAIVSSVLVFVAMFQDAGLSMATIQRKDINHRQVSNLFWVNTAAGSAVALFTVLIAPLMVLFFDDERLGPITVALALPSLLAGMSSQHGALLQRQMRFGVEQGIVIASQIVGAGVAIVSAIYGASYWSLVFKSISAALVVVVCRWYASGWMPGLPSKGTGVREMVRFGAHLTIGQLFMTVTRNVDNLLLGYFFGPTALGLYSKAYGLLMLPIRQINKPMGTVALPALSRLQTEPQRFKQYYLRGLVIVATVGMPIVAFAAVAADEIVLLMLGPSWVDTIDIFRALAPAAFVGSTNVATGWLFVPMGRVKEQLKIVLINSIITIVGFGVGLNWGAIGVATSFSVTSVLLKAPSLMYACKGSPVRLSDIAKSTSRPMIASLVASVALYFFEPYQNVGNAIFECAVLFGVFASAYLICIVALPGGLGFVRELISTFGKLRKRN
ncbi:lipopolysaccharide biosynthesis protein [Pelagicoccus albus]|uniref:Lipopolysaccharide biosynthesis protein n=1 Tax=Pelagicoccus albus TaxID=415222 RepID=A0A7X1EA90_9BACT|nr:lipopolysaccharide biosynthesis protein [Pelagicoccus albus]MBC2608254.1 lipopolysaccharide biosynthesis protein [Pelagicoccus albus]